MILRTIILVVAALMLTGALAGAIVEPGMWPFALFVLVVVIGTWFERRRYGALQARPVGADWRATAERFIDDESGRPVTIWFNSRTGERRYVQDEAR